VGSAVNAKQRVREVSRETAKHRSSAPAEVGASSWRGRPGEVSRDLPQIQFGTWVMIWTVPPFAIQAKSSMRAIES